jgi:preprotein translocase subunit SecG
LTQVGLPDPAVLEVQQAKPAVEDVPVLEEQAPAAEAADVPQAPEQ